MGRFVRRLVGEVSGATAIEYGLIAALIAVAIIAAVSQLGLHVGGVFYYVSQNL